MGLLIKKKVRMMNDKKIEKIIRKKEKRVDEKIRELEEEKKGRYKGSIIMKKGGGEKIAIKADKIAEKELEEENNQNMNQKSAS